MKSKDIKKNSNYFEKVLKNPYLPFIAIFIIMLVTHSFTNFFRDDLYFSTQLVNTNLFDYIKMRYLTWSSRIITEIYFVFFTNHRTLWIFIDSLAYSSIAYLLSKLFNKENDTKLNWIIAIIMLIYPFTDMSSAGYITTTIFYIWPLLSFLYIMYILKWKMDNKNISKWQVILLVIAIINAVTSEQACLLTAGFTFLAILKKIFDKNFKIKENKTLLAILGSCVLYLIFIATCPGNHMRTISETATWYPDYANFSILPKIYLGVIPTFSVIMNNGVIITLTTLLLCLFTLKNNKKNYNKIFSIIVFAFFSLTTIFKSNLLNIFPNFSHFYEILSLESLPTLNLLNILPFALCCASLIGVIYLLYINFKDNLLLPIIFIAGFCSRFIMGFSPTVFASHERTSIFFYFSMLIIDIIIYSKLQKNKNIFLVDTLLIILMLCSVLSTMVSLLSIIYS